MCIGIELKSLDVYVRFRLEIVDIFHPFNILI